MNIAGEVVSVRALDVSVVGRRLLEQVNLQLRAGELVVIVGRNGAGKSTLLRNISGEVASRGRIRVFGQLLEEQRLKELARRRAVLAQHTQLNFGYEVEEVVLLGRIPHQVRQTETSEDRRLARESLARVGMAEFAERNYLTLSGGEQQRVHLARVLAQLAGNEGDSLLLLDEPTSSLDIAYQHQVLRLARELGRDGVGVLAVLHDLNLAAQYADRMVMLAEGAVLAYGTPDEVLTPDNIARAFDHEVLVLKHPTKGFPLVVSAS